jgi:hypothetical protein
MREGSPGMALDRRSGLAHLLLRQNDLITATQARRYLSDAALRHRVESGRWQRLHRGIFLANSGRLSPTQRLWLAVLAAGPGAVLAGPSATAEYGLHPAPPAVHVLVPAGRHPSRAPTRVIIHQSAVLPPGDIHRLALPPRTMPARSVVDAACWAASDESARAVVASGFQRGLVTLAEIAAVLDRLPRARRRGLIMEAANDASGGSHSLAELDYLRHNRAYGLPEPQRQAVRRDARGRRRYLDVRYGEWRVCVEIDGAQHQDPAASWADMRRQNDIWIAGDRVLRFPAWLVRRHPAEVFAQVCTALSAAGWHPPKGS